MKEIFELIQDELNRLGFSDVPGGFVLTGGVVNMPGVLELAQYILQNRVRITAPDYIGVREPQYTTAVGLIKYAYKKIEFKEQSVCRNHAASGPIQEAFSQEHQSKHKSQKTTDKKKVSIKIQKNFWLLF